MKKLKARSYKKEIRAVQKTLKKISEQLITYEEPVLDEPPSASERMDDVVKVAPELIDLINIAKAKIEAE